MPPEKRTRVILNTDAKNEAGDQRFILKDFFAKLSRFARGVRELAIFP